MARNIEQQLRDATRQSGLSILALSKRSGVPYSAMHRFVTGAGCVGLRSAAKLAKVLGLELRPVRRSPKGR